MLSVSVDPHKSVNNFSAFGSVLGLVKFMKSELWLF